MCKNNPLWFLLLSLAMICNASFVAYAGADEVRPDARSYCFRTVNVSDGLSQNTVLKILQDRTGYMWFGTKDGLNRYDGRSFRIYSKDNSELRCNIITNLAEDGDGNIWIGTDRGVYKYDPVTDRISDLSSVTEEGVRITCRVSGLEWNRDRGEVWISVEKQGFFVYSMKDKTLRLMFHSPLSISSFARVGDRLWFGHYLDNLYFVDTDFSGRPSVFKDVDGKEVFSGETVNTITGGGHNRVYVGTTSRLLEINLTNRKTRLILNDYVRAMAIRDNEELWVGGESGLHIIDTRDGSVKRHITAPDQDEKYSLADNAIYSLFKDREQGMWIGSYFGGLNYLPYPYTLFEKYYPHGDMSFLGRRVREFCQDKNGTIWIGTEDKGLFSMNPESGQVKPWQGPARHKNVHGLFADGDWLWVGTFSEGLSRINLKTGKVVHYAKGQKGFPENNAFSILRTSSGDLIIAMTVGAVVYDDRTDTFRAIPELDGTFVYQVLETSDGDLWFATYADGLYRFEVSQGRWTRYKTSENPGDTRCVGSDNITSIFEDSSHRLWITTLGGGFCRFHPEDGTFTRFSSDDGFPGSVYYKVIEDKDKNLWITSENGLIRFRPETGEKQLYTTANGLLSDQFNFQSGFRSKSGKIYIGSINGFIAFDPSSFRKNEYVPPVTFTDFYLFGDLMKPCSEGSPLKNNITFTDRIVLKHNQNTFSLRLSALSYLTPEMNKIEYKVEGLDEKWSEVDKSSMITCSNLPHGHYRIKIRGSNGDGVANPEARSLEVVIKPPFYLTVLAKIMYVVMVIVLAASAFFVLYRRAKRRQMDEMERFGRKKEKELYDAKINFFTDIAHEIRTPLTLINCTIDDIFSSKNIPDNLTEDMNVVGSNTKRLLELVNQLLDFRKAESKGYRLDIVKTDAAVILKSVVCGFRVMAERKNVSLTTDIPDSLTAYVDKDGFTKIITNLLNNAVKFSCTYIHVKLFSDSGNLVFTVSNDGPRIPEEMREEIFRPFVQCRPNDSNATKGTGLGLALARSLAILQGGALDVDDSADDNSFILRLPLSNEHVRSEVADKLEATDGAGPETQAPANSDERYSVLLVEDSQDMMNFLARQFSSTCNVFTASDGNEALTVLKNNNISLIISDVMMPGMNGMELCRKVKSDVEFSHIPVILLTARTDSDSKVQGMNIGADAYIEKPFSMDYLKACAGNLVSGRKKLRAAFARQPQVQSDSVAMTRSDELFLRSMRNLVTQNIQNPDFNIDDLAAGLGMSRSSLNRKVKGILDMTPVDYIRVERLKKAALLLREGECRVSEVCYLTGFNTPSYFSKCFQKQFGVLPKDYIDTL
mgnify:FL=1